MELSDDKFRHFNLRRYFSVFSISIIIILTAVLSYLAFWNQKQVLIDYSISSAEATAHRINYRVRNELLTDTYMDRTESGTLGGTGMIGKIKGLIDDYLKDNNEIMKLKLFNNDMQVLYSTEDYDNGLLHSPEIKLALGGKTNSVFTKSTELAEGGAARKGSFYLVDMLVVYVPFYRDVSKPEKSGIIGAFEIHKKVSPLFSLLHENFYKIPLILVIAMGSLYFSLQVVIRKADRIIQKKNDEIDSYNAELEEAQKVIKASMDEVIEHESFHVRYESEKLLKCWEFKNCDYIQCPSYKSDDLRCWQVAGTFCGGKIQGIFANKYGDCRKCDVYKFAFKDRIDMIGESFNNMMTLLQNKHYEMHTLNNKLNVLIDIDPLTEIGNRRSFQKRIESISMLSLRHNRTYSIILYDVDNFKLYNDTYGHQKGDYVLITIAKTLKQSLRKTDEIFRWGGEEFVIILPEQNLLDALKVAENLRKEIERLGIEHKMNIPGVVTISCGVSCNSDNINDVWETVLKQADDALYRAKQAGRNCVFATSENDYVP